MKKSHYSFALLMGTVLFTACNSGDGTTSVSDSSSTSTSTAETTITADTSATSAGTTGMAQPSSTPLERMDQAFVLKAASGGVMEVEAGRIAQENASSQRVKDFGAMMVRDHGMANQELMSIASAKGLMIPQDSLMTVHQKHLDAMKKMKGTAFDKHYINMMKDHHNKDIADFEKASTGANDADVKSFATKTLPTLRTHKDSVQAISSMK
ncbi:MAG TPA: DUF4142 domain-containing protein [Flavisolibacter sp.]|jgi:putative membrane protein